MRRFAERRGISHTPRDRRTPLPASIFVVLLVVGSSALFSLVESFCSTPASCGRKPNPSTFLLLEKKRSTFFGVHRLVSSRSTTTTSSSTTVRLMSSPDDDSEEDDFVLDDNAISPRVSDIDHALEEEDDDDDIVLIDGDDVDDIEIEDPTSSDNIITNQNDNQNDDDDEDDDDDDFIDEIDLDEEEDDEEEFYFQNMEITTNNMLLDWDEHIDGADYELQDDPSDPNYMKQRELVEEAVQDSLAKREDEAFDPIEYAQNQLTEEMKKKIESLDIFKEIEQRAAALSVDDVNPDQLDQQVRQTPNILLESNDEDDYDLLGQYQSLSPTDLQQLENTYKDIHQITNEDVWDKVMFKDLNGGWDDLSNETLAEIDDCLEEIGGSAYNVTRWLLYDLDFNVTNLILAAVKHNPQAPILFHHWYPQLVVYKRYQDARDRDFDFTWDDVSNADVSELERYYAGFGYDEGIPQRAPGETGIVGLENLDEEEIRMAEFENWMKEVYNAEWDRQDFDDDDFQDEQNPFSEFYEPPQNPDLPSFEDALDDIEEWERETADEEDDGRPKMAKVIEYRKVEDKEFEKEFRGHLVIACTAMDSDLEVAERITARFEKEFGKQIFVETRVLALAREEDNVFEVWLESYEIDLLHSRKRANARSSNWEGPSDVDEEQLDYLVSRVKFLVSDEARYSYRFEFDMVE